MPRSAVRHVERPGLQPGVTAWPGLEPGRSGGIASLVVYPSPAPDLALVRFTWTGGSV
jgi:hypothetical protein